MTFAYPAESGYWADCGKELPSQFRRYVQRKLAQDVWAIAYTFRARRRLRWVWL